MHSDYATPAKTALLILTPMGGPGGCPACQLLTGPRLANATYVGSRPTLLNSRRVLRREPHRRHRVRRGPLAEPAAVCAAISPAAPPSGIPSTLQSPTSASRPSPVY